MTDTFLTDAEILKLTGVSHKDKDRHRLMVAELVRLGIPHYVNRASKIIVVRAVIEGEDGDVVAWADLPACKVAA